MKLKLPWAKKPKNSLAFLIFFILLSQAAGSLGTIFTIPAIPTWYADLIKPFFSPPNWLFGPVWIMLYTLMGISAYLVWRKHQFDKKARVFWELFAAQLVLNALWTPLFFGAKWLGVSFFEILALWYFIMRTIKEAGKLDLYSAYILYPYLAWVSFAAVLNFALWILNY
jgi:translocator protein